jgi:hypothetical protein
MNCLYKLTGFKQLNNAVELRLIVPKDAGSEIIRLAKSGQLTGEFRVDDGRNITAKQRHRISRNIKDIADHLGYGFYECMVWLLYEFNSISGAKHQHFETMDITTAREFINYLMDFVFRFDIPLNESGLMRNDDINRYLWLCLKYHRCCITGKPADIHHCTGSHVGMGNNRKTISNVGRKLMALSREWHTKVHAQGETEIFEKYKIHGITLTADELVQFGISEEEIT